MNSSRQLGLGPMALNNAAAAQATRGNGIASAQTTPGNLVASESVALSDVVLAAAGRLGFSSDDLGSVFGLSVPEVSKCFGPNNPDRNRVMKQQLPMALARQVALVLCEQTGLAVGGPDAERHALADLLTKCADYIRVMGAGR